MNKQTGIKKQRGFVDLGISLIILAIGGTTAAVVTPADEQVATSPVQQIEPVEVTNSQPLISYDIDS